MLQRADLKNRRILVVEDVELNQYLARHIMESWGCIVDIAENGSLAVDRVKDADYDLVLMDIQMPVLDGVEATRKIRALEDEYRCNVPIVALTANANQSESKKYLEVGMNDWLGKPFEEPALFNTVSKNIRKTSNRNISSRINAPVEKSVEPGEKLFDLTMIEAISGGDKNFVTKMLALFLETVPNTLHDIRSSTDAGEWQMLGKQAHKLKSTIDSMGIVSLKQDIREIEAGGKNGGSPERMRELVDKVIRVMGEVMEEVRKS